MRKSVLSIMLLFAISMAASAQKFALIDTEYILKNIPAYQSANEQLQEATKKYQSEVEVIAKEAQKMFQDYQAQSPIQDEIYGAVKELSQVHGYDLVLDRASTAGIIFGNPRIDISDEVLRKLGYSN